MSQTAVTSPAAAQPTEGGPGDKQIPAEEVFEELARGHAADLVGFAQLRVVLRHTNAALEEANEQLATVQARNRDLEQRVAELASQLADANLGKSGSA